MFFTSKKGKKILKTEYKLKQMNLVSYQVDSMVTPYKESLEVTFKQNFDYIVTTGYNLRGKKGQRKFKLHSVV